MGIYKRENGICYLKVFYEGRNRRISLETKNKRFAQEMYDNFLRGKVYQKFSKFHKTSDEESTSQESKIKLPHFYQQYLGHCSLQNFTKATLQSKKPLLKVFKSNKIAYLDDFDQHALNKLFETWKHIPKDTLRKHIAKIKAFLNYCHAKFNLAF